MAKKQLQQIKIFKIEDFETMKDLQESVNNYVIQCHNKEGNYPKIETNSRFISVVSDCLVDTTS